MIVYAVVYGNYYPLEIERLFITEELAKKHAEQLDGDYRVVRMKVWDTDVPKEEDES